MGVDVEGEGAGGGLLSFSGLVVESGLGPGGGLS